MTSDQVVCNEHGDRSGRSAVCFERRREEKLPNDIEDDIKNLETSKTGPVIFYHIFEPFELEVSASNQRSFGCVVSSLKHCYCIAFAQRANT